MNRNMPNKPLIQATPSGLYCERGDFYIDPLRPVERAMITHGHSDHARQGSEKYYATRPSRGILEHRLGNEIDLTTLAYGEPFELNGVKVSFHPAGHILGSAQIRIEDPERDGDNVWVVSGDYKRQTDPTCAPFEVVSCDTFITETTFGLPVYRWEPGEVIARDILRWWDKNRAENKTSILFCYALGKAQRILGELARLSERQVYLHGAMAPLVEVYRAEGVTMLPTVPVSETDTKNPLAGELVLAPSSASRSPWMKRFKHFETGFASGWMRIRGTRRRRGFDRGFVLSDHADWPGLLRTIKETGASRVLPTHGNTHSLVRHLQDRGIQAGPLEGYIGEYGIPEEV